MPKLPDLVSIGELAMRSGVATSALRYYESRGLIAASRNAGNHRRYPRAALRRIAFIRAAQSVGLTLQEIRDALARLPSDRTPTRADWERLARPWRRSVDERIAELEGLRDDLTGCIGCGCLSLRRCRLFNRDDQAAANGAGARYLLGDEPPDVDEPSRHRATAAR